MVLEDCAMDISDYQKDEQVYPKASKAWNKTEAILLLEHHEKARFFGRDNIAKKTREQQKKSEDQIWDKWTQ